MTMAVIKSELLHLVADHLARPAWFDHYLWSDLYAVIARHCLNFLAGRAPAQTKGWFPLSVAAALLPNDLIEGDQLHDRGHQIVAAQNRAHGMIADRHVWVAGHAYFIAIG